MAKILVLSSHTPSLFNFRMDMMKAMLARGHKVYAAGDLPENEWKTKFLELGIDYHQIFVSRNGVNPISDFKTIRDIHRVINEIRPECLFVDHGKTIAYGCPVAKFAGVPGIYPMLGGLGSVFRRDDKSIVKSIMTILYRFAFKNSDNVFLQNKDDLQKLIDSHVLDRNKVVMVNGSGVNLERFKPKPFPETLTFIFIGRLIKDKGIGEYLEACRILKDKYRNQIKCLLVGPYDTNPSALKPQELANYTEVGIIDYKGEQADVRTFIEQSTVMVLPSYHEGTPKAVLEAMAVGRPIVTTDAPGCRNTVIRGKNGFLVPVKDTSTLAERMEKFVKNPQLVNAMGEESRKIAEDKFDVNKVNDLILQTMNL